MANNDRETVSITGNNNDREAVSIIGNNNGREAQNNTQPTMNARIIHGGGERQNRQTRGLCWSTAAACTAAAAAAAAAAGHCPLWFMMPARGLPDTEE